MRRKLIIGIVVSLLVGVAAFFIFLNKNDDSNSSNFRSVNSLDDQLKKACNFLTEEKAKTIIGSKAQKLELSDGGASSSSDSIVVSQCVYVDSLQELGDNAQSTKIDLVVRIPRDETGKASNKDVFDGQILPARSEGVAGFGEKAFWNEEFGQLNVLKDEMWYIFEYGSDVPQRRNLEDTRRAAEILFNP